MKGTREVCVQVDVATRGSTQILSVLFAEGLGRAGGSLFAAGARLRAVL